MINCGLIMQVWGSCRWRAAAGLPRAVREVVTRFVDAWELACARSLDSGGVWAAHSVNVPALRGAEVSGFHAFPDPALFPGFGLPAVLADR